MRIGFHVSIAGSIDRAVDNALAMNCTAFQIFTRNPRGWRSKPLLKKDAESFRAKLVESKIDRAAICAHMPYLPNLSSPNKGLYRKSLNTVLNEVKRCTLLGIPYLVLHLGSHLGSGVQAGIKNLAYACNTIADKERNSNVTILLENMAGQKNSVGSRFEELKQILDLLDDGKRFGVCFDTCHAFAAGYDLRSSDKVQDVISEFDRYVGMKNLRVVHLNDSKGDLNCNWDRHDHIGMGYIGERGFRAILAQKEFRKLPLIMETPIDDRRDDAANLAKVRELAGIA